ncbi:MAG: hypothetical protein KME52_18670 [Desmonostoc geniculatum HA4340-LM1]|jgi:hypothetical protein|nr:hypothetical protein [Desmonostoc geniculatum HA4340-LM1]
MTTLKIKDADGATKHVATTGMGTADDPLKTQQSITGAVAINQPLPAGENNIGKVEVTAMPPLSVGEVAVSNFPTSFQVTNFPATQTITGSVAVSNFPSSFQISNFPESFEISNFPATQTIAGNVGVSNFPASFQVSNFPATQTVAGSVSVSNFPNTLATETTLGTRLSEGTNVTGVSLPSGGSGAFGWLSAIWKIISDRLPTALVGGRLDINVGAGSVNVGNFPATQTISGSVSISNFPATQAVSGTITANLGTTGTDITGVTMPSGGAGIQGWLSAIWKLIGDRLPSALASDRLKVDIPALPTGSNAIGNVGVSSLPVAFNTGTASSTTQRVVIASDDALINQLKANTSYTTTATPVATDGTSGDKTILTPTSGKALRISSLCLVMSSATAITLKKGSTAISGAMTISELVTDFPQPIALAIDQTFAINIGSAIAVNGFVTWWEA